MLPRYWIAIFFFHGTDLDIYNECEWISNYEEEGSLLDRFFCIPSIIIV